VNRADFQQLADVRIDEAKVLLDQGKYDGAYYLAGYAVECALKACIAKLIKEYDFPDKDFVKDSYTHVVATLLTKAGIDGQLNTDMKADPNLGVNWNVVKDWKEDSRYKRKSEREARELYNAITDTTNGILPWIKSRW
jgi:hypothetical protein